VTTGWRNREPVPPPTPRAVVEPVASANVAGLWHRSSARRAVLAQVGALFYRWRRHVNVLQGRAARSASCWHKLRGQRTHARSSPTPQRAAIRKTLGARNAAARCREALMLRFGRRSYGTLVKIWPRGTPAATSGEGLCVYITGFMSDTKDDGYWESWLPAHRQLVAAPLPWPEQAYGYRWQTGATGDWLGRWPLPVHAAALLARRSSPAALLAGITADSLVNATRCTPAILFSHHPLLATSHPARTTLTTPNPDPLTLTGRRPTAQHPLQAADALPLGGERGCGGGAAPCARLRSLRRRLPCRGPLPWLPARARGPAVPACGAAAPRGAAASLAVL